MLRCGNSSYIEGGVLVLHHREVGEIGSTAGHLGPAVTVSVGRIFEVLFGSGASRVSGIEW